MEQYSMSRYHIHELFIKFLHQMEQYEDKESSAFLEELRKTVTVEAPMNMTDIHVIACIGHNEPIKLTSIADKMELSKGNISKVTTKLLKAGWLRKTQLNDNKKEIFFRLTPSGKKLFIGHEELHLKAQEQFLQFINPYKEAELEIIKSFLVELTKYYGKNDL
ncbi:MarR family transcriptional regulator [Paenibacillus agricola]|uniref:MarR family transcriptional regulator n=1 Tax=Paenibacillus agricola TaxID=2716264 RepID=A0ABX0J4B4_9BACL|nr:MarR family transcriptional regulator [Paenibacillus agricola]NHN30818.1 MarR family transcriptional regulator [Paenibacillus agricola]